MPQSEIEKMVSAARASNPQSELDKYLVGAGSEAAARASALNLSDSLHSAKAYADRQSIADSLSETARTVFAAQEARDRGFLDTVTSRISDSVAERFAQQVRSAAEISPAVRQLSELTEQLKHARRDAIFQPMRVPDMPVVDFKSPINDLRETFEHDAEERRKIELRQLEVLEQMAALAKSSVEAAECAAADAKRDSLASRSTAVRANVFALVSIFVTVVLAREELAKLFLWLVQKLP